MARLTDEDVERLLRETFADMEKLVADKDKLADPLPEAIKRRRPIAPILLAAAAVLVVLGGILYGVNRGDGADPAPPVATAPLAGAATDDADIWAAVIATIAQKHQPEGGWQALIGLEISAVGQERARKGPEFTEPQKKRMTELLAKVAPLQWPGSVGTAASCKNRSVAEISVGDVVDAGDHKEVIATISFNCSAGDSAIYRVERVGGIWTVTGVIRSATVFTGACAQSASPRAGC
jgi:hypothetical protein